MIGRLLVGAVVVAGLAVAPAGSASADDAVPTVTGVSPGTADWQAGATITVTGTGFADGDRVVIADVNKAYHRGRHIVVKSATKVEFTVPVEHPGAFDVRVSSAVGSSAITAHDHLKLTNIIASPWQAAHVPAPSDSASPREGDHLSRVSCSDVSDCAAWGDYDNDKRELNRSLDASSEGVWTSVRAPMPADAVEHQLISLGDVSCGAGGQCVVLGRYRAQVGLRSFVERLSNGTWSADTVPVPSGEQAGERVILHSVSCAGGQCVAVGAGKHRPSITTFSNGGWATQFAPMPAGATGVGHLSSVSCPTTTWCVAVGTFDNANHHADFLVETLNDRTWTASVLPLPADAATTQIDRHRIRAISCGSVGFCTAIGQYRKDPNGGRPLLVTLDAGAWKPVQAPLPSVGQRVPARSFQLDYVSCAPSDTCVSVQKIGEWPYAVETLHAGHWTATQAAVPAGSGTFQTSYGVSCSAPGHCMFAESVWVSNTLVQDPAVATYNHGSWSATDISEPDDDDQGAYMTDSWCGSDGGCVVVGSSGSIDTGVLSVVETLPAKD